jgi:hypothetical protein
MRKEALFALEWLYERRPDRDVFVQMDPALLATVRQRGLRPERRLRAADMIHDVPTRIKAYGDILAFPDEEHEFFKAWAERELESLKSAATKAVPDLQNALQDPQTDSRVRREIEEAMKYIVPRPTPPSKTSQRS